MKASDVHSSANLVQGNVRERARIVADSLRRYIEEGVESGTLRIGDQIPTERELMSMFGGGRSIVRKTLIALEKEGKLERRVGSGTFIADRDFINPEGNLDKGFLKLAAQEASPSEVMELRLVFEPRAAALAAMRANALETKKIRDCFVQSQNAKSLNAFEKADDAFHAAISSATRNLLFKRVYEIVSAVRNQTEWSAIKQKTLMPEHRRTHDEEHKAILEAIETRDSLRAEEAMLEHLKSVDRGLFS